MREESMAQQKRIELTEDIMERFFDEVFPGEISEFSAHKGLPYGLIYNLVHGRISSLSAADYRRIFGEDPPDQEQSRSNGEYFRAMVKLWLFLNDNVTEKDLFSEFYKGRKALRKPDYRIFTGATKTVEKRIERIMERKFLEQGLTEDDIKEWIKDFDRYPEEERVSFEKVKPILERLEKNVKAHPSRLLNRWIASYESGELKTISSKLFKKLKALDRKAEEAAKRPSRAEFEKIREEVYGSREGLTLFSEIEEELEFLKFWGHRSPKKYLGRSAGKYMRSKLKRVANWRMQNILKDCERLIVEKPHIPVRSLPRRYRTAHWRRLTIALEQAAVAQMLSKDKLSFEKQVLQPVYRTKNQYESKGHGYVSVREAATALGMSEKAYALLMGAHCDVFRKIGRYKGGWTIPDLYLSELADRSEFPLVRAKYEWIAKKTRQLYLSSGICASQIPGAGTIAGFAHGRESSQEGHPA
jgi:hypothetical protein